MQEIRFIQKNQLCSREIKIKVYLYGINYNNYMSNTFQDKAEGDSHIKIFTKAEVAPKLIHNHTFGCPVFVLKNLLDINTQFKLKPQTQLYVNQGTYPQYLLTINLVLILM